MLDILIKNAVLTDGSKIDIGVKNGKIVALDTLLNLNAVQTFVMESGSYISAGWIDDHVHCNPTMDIYYDEPDLIGVHSGVCTVIDAGSCGYSNVDAFFQCVKNAKTNVYALLNISDIGLIRQDELSDLSLIQIDHIKEKFNMYPDFLLGIKARMSQSVVGDNGIQPLVMAKKIQKELGDIPLMVHIGSAPPPLEDIMPLLDHHDMVTHCFNGKANSIIDSDMHIKSCVLCAQKRGVAFDLGHGTASFDFNVARHCFNLGFKCCTISTDIYHRNRVSGPVMSFAVTLSKMLHLGYSLEEIIDKVTRAPAEFFKIQNKGKIEIGYDADFTIFEVKDAQFEAIDSSGNREIIHKLIQPRHVIVGGVMIDMEEIQ